MDSGKAFTLQVRRMKKSVLTRLADLGDALYGTADIGLGFEVMGMPSNIMATAEGDGVGMLSGHSSQSSRNLESGDNAACAMAS